MGSRKEGGEAGRMACASNAECASGNCRESQCVEEPDRVGEHGWCSPTHSLCATGLVCRAKSRTCVLPSFTGPSLANMCASQSECEPTERCAEGKRSGVRTCVPRSVLGAECNVSAREDECLDGLACVPISPGSPASDGTCMPRCVVRDTLDALLRGQWACESGSVCAEHGSSSANPLTCAVAEGFLPRLASSHVHLTGNVALGPIHGLILLLLFAASLLATLLVRRCRRSAAVAVAEASAKAAAPHSADTPEQSPHVGTISVADEEDQLVYGRASNPFAAGSSEAAAPPSYLTYRHHYATGAATPPPPEKR